MHKDWQDKQTALAQGLAASAANAAGLGLSGGQGGAGPSEPLQQDAYSAAGKSPGSAYAPAVSQPGPGPQQPQLPQTVMPQQQLGGAPMAGQPYEQQSPL